MCKHPFDAAIVTGKDPETLSFNYDFVVRSSKSHPDFSFECVFYHVLITTKTLYIDEIYHHAAHTGLTTEVAGA